MFNSTKVSFKVWMFIALLSLAHLFVGYKIAGRLGLFVGFTMAVILNIMIFFFGETQLLARMRARKLSGQDPWGLNDIVKKYAKLVGLAAPSVYLMEHMTATAFSIGRPWKRGSICVSTGLLKDFTPQEVEAILVNQVCHIKRSDTFSFGVTSTIANSFVGLAQFLDHLWPVNWFKGPLHHRPFATLLSPLAWIVIRFAVSDRNYFESDDLAVSLLTDRKALAQALWKLEGLSHTKPLHVPPCTSHLFIVNPEGLRETNWFFLTHPKMENRIRRLLGYFPI